MTQNNMGTALVALGEFENPSKCFIEACKAYRAALDELDAERTPFYWSMVQHNLGIALRHEGARTKNIELLNETVAVLRNALKIRTQNRMPSQWQSTQYYLAWALLDLGTLENDAIVLLQAAQTAETVMTMHPRAKWLVQSARKALERGRQPKQATRARGAKKRRRSPKPSS
jgi:tetratricopeptide (TPR) repeat protein